MEPAERPPDFEPGALLRDTYRVVRSIARGGMGTVYLAEHLRLDNRHVAIKVMTVDLSRSGELLPRFKREAEICAKLAHPNIITVTDWNSLPNGMPFLVMEYLEGTDLAARIQRGKMSPEEALPIIGSIAAGLGAAHARGVIHRDLKPSNVFLVDAGGDTPHVKLLDFGISKLVWEQTLETTSPKLLGSPRYMAPEQARGENERIDARTDQFALGAVAYEMFAGKPAFDGETLSTVLYRVVHEPPAPLATLAPELPARMVKAVERAMHKDPEKRFPDLATFVAALRGDLSSATLPSTGQQAARALRPRGGTLRAQLGRWGAPLGGVLVVAGLVLFGVLSAEVPHPEGAAPDVFPAPAPSTVKVTTTPAPSPSPEVAAEPVEPAPARPAPVVETEQAKRHLDDAQAFLDAGDFANALRKAHQALGVQDVPRAHLIVALAHCAASSLGDAKAALPRVAPADRPKVLRACKAKGVEL